MHVELTVSLIHLLVLCSSPRIFEEKRDCLQSIATKANDDEDDDVHFFSQAYVNPVAMARANRPAVSGPTIRDYLNRNRPTL